MSECTEITKHYWVDTGDGKTSRCINCDQIREKLCTPVPPEIQAAYDKYIEAGQNLMKLMEPIRDEEVQFYLDEVRDMGPERMIDDIDIAANIFEIRYSGEEDEEPQT